MSGTVFAQVLNILSAPLLTRLYVPEDFGVFAYYTSILSVLTVMMTLKYETAIVLPKSDRDASNLLLLSMMITTIIALFILMIISISGSYISKIFGATDLIKWLWFMPISALLAGLNNTFEFWSTRNKAYSHITSSKVLRSVSVTTMQISGGIGRFGATGLIIGQMAGQFISSCFLMYMTWKESKMEIVRSFERRSMMDVMKRYRDFPLFSCSQSLVNSISQNAAPFILGFFYGSTVVGYYAIALKLISLPASIVSESVRQVFFQKVSSLHNEGKRLSNSLIKMTLYLGLTAIIPSIILLFFAPILFCIFLGENWYEAGQYSSLLVIWLFFSFINQPSIAVIQVLLKQRILLLYEVTLFICRVLAMILVAFNYSSVISIAAYSVIGAVFNAMLVLSVIIYTMNKEKME